MGNTLKCRGAVSHCPLESEAMSHLFRANGSREKGAFVGVAMGCASFEALRR